jgi:hypothetical protein
MTATRAQRKAKDITHYKPDRRLKLFESAWSGEDSCYKALEGFSSGLTVVEVAASLGISQATFYAWCERYPSFRKATEVGRTYQEAAWAKQGRKNLNDPTFQTPLYKFLSVNQFGWLSERQAMQHSGEIGLALRPVDEGERKERAELARLRAAGEIERLRIQAHESLVREAIGVKAGPAIEAPSDAPGDAHAVHEGSDDKPLE